MYEMTLEEARVERLSEVTAFVDGALEEAGCSMRAQMQIDVAVEEIYVNIAHYAYAPAIGPAVIRLSVTPSPGMFEITFIDEGVAFDPVSKADPDVTLPVEQRQIGGLGIYMVKKSMDEVLYAREDGKNVLTLRKRL